MFSVLLLYLYLYNPCMLFTCGGNKEYYYYCFGVGAQVQINTIFEHTIVNIFLPISFNICFGCSKEPSQSFGYPQHNYVLVEK